jgi:hypothetical protein
MKDLKVSKICGHGAVAREGLLLYIPEEIPL